MKTKLLWAELERAADRTRELEAALREIGKIAHAMLTKSADRRQVADWGNELSALAAWPEVAGQPQDRLPGAVLQANSDGTISKVDPDPLTAQDKSSMIQRLREMADKLEGKEP